MASQFEPLYRASRIRDIFISIFYSTLNIRESYVCLPTDVKI